MMEIFGRIYVVTCSVNGKQYVGQTTVSITTRWSNHKYTSDSGGATFLYNAMRKHGSHNFLVDEIDTAESHSELNSKEIFHIERLNTLSPNGYNLTQGGDADYSRTHSEETKKRIGLSHIGHKHTQETKDAMSKARKKEFCNRGHSLTDIINLYINPTSGQRRCKQCMADWLQRYRDKKRPLKKPKVLTAEHRQNISTGLRKGRKEDICFHGHLLSPENLYISPKTGQRRCRQCYRDWRKDHKSERIVAKVVE